MDLNEIRDIIESVGGKFIIVENKKPVLVVVSFEDYKKGLKKDNFVKFPPSSLNLQNTVMEQRGLPKELEEEELKIEDLPY